MSYLFLGATTESQERTEAALKESDEKYAKQLEDIGEAVAELLESKLFEEEEK